MKEKTKNILVASIRLSNQDAEALKAWHEKSYSTGKLSKALRKDESPSRMLREFVKSMLSRVGFKVRINSEQMSVIWDWFHGNHSPTGSETHEEIIQVFIDQAVEGVQKAPKDEAMGLRMVTPPGLAPREAAFGLRLLDSEADAVISWYNARHPKEKLGSVGMARMLHELAKQAIEDISI